MIVEQKVKNLGQRFNLSSSNQTHGQADKITIPLLLHQKTALYEMVTLETKSTHVEYCNKTIKSNVGYISDQPGSGKSLMILSLIASDHKINGFWNSHLNALYTMEGLYLDTNIIIVPPNILNQWKYYIANQTTFTYQVIDSLIPTVTVTVTNSDVKFHNTGCNIPFEKLTDDITLVSSSMADEIFKMNIPSLFDPWVFTLW